tara:strand:- start:3734 stop:4294 length:561 start_codon:yes stop_codon:yes gene_type:complete
MSATKALFGLRPSRKRGGNANSTGSNTYDIASAYNANIFSGDPVVLVAGKVNVMTGDTDRLLGVFTGCEYIQNGEQKWSSYWPASTSATNIKAHVIDDPAQLYIVQADASITAGDIGELNFGVTLGAGSTVTKRSGFGIKAATRNTTLLALRAISLVDEPGNTITSAFPKVEARIVQHLDSFASAA